MIAFWIVGFVQLSIEAKLQMWRFAKLIGIVWCLALLPELALGTVNAPVTVAEMATQSSLVVDAVVTGENTVAKTQGSIWSCYELQIVETIKGSAENKLQPLCFLGGKLNDVEMRVDGYDLPAVGTRAIFFITDLSRPYTNPLYGLSQGFVPIQKRDGVDIVTAVTGAPVIGLRPTHQRPDAYSSTRVASDLVVGPMGGAGLSVDRFKALIRSIFEVGGVPSIPPDNTCGMSCVVAWLSPTSAAAQQVGDQSAASWAEAGASVFLQGLADSQAAFKTAAQRWNFSTFTFEVVDDATGAQMCGHAPGANVMLAYFSPTMCGAAFPPNTYAQVVYTYSSSGRYISSADIVFNSNFSFDIYSGPLRPAPQLPDLTRIAVHELGRLAGVPNSTDPAAIMYPQPTNVEAPITEDFNAIDAIYVNHPGRPPGGYKCLESTVPPSFVGVGPISSSYSLSTSCLDAEHHNSVDYTFSTTTPLNLSISLAAQRTELDFQVMNSQGTVVYSDVDSGKLEKSYTAELNPGNYSVRVWREVAATPYQLYFTVH
jgi:hypothetical protein